MGGKSKQTQRTRNNAKPSSSARSAELLGDAATKFVGFSTHSEHGLVAFAPGFGAGTFQMMMANPEAGYDLGTGTDPQLQLIMRKFSKKDPMTKKKALKELYDQLDYADLITMKSVLPVWPKHYQQLATDPDHSVREMAQHVLERLASKCKRDIAPYLRQLVPVWLASHFDSYVNAAETARFSFSQTFAAPKRIQEVCLHCQTEIFEYVTQNLTVHTADTLSSGKHLTPEEAEHKYQRVVVGSLKTLSFFVEHTGGGNGHGGAGGSASPRDLTQVQESLRSVLVHQKFLSFAKSKLPAIKAAWFELLYHLLQSSSLVVLLADVKPQLIAVCFQNIDENHPLVVPHVWGCVLLLQSTYADWHASVNFRKAIFPKLSSLLCNGINRNAKAICPNLLPFFAHLTQECLQDLDLNVFHKKFFDDFLHSVIPNNSKVDCAIIIKSYFECLRYLLQQLNNKAAEQRTEAEESLANGLLQENILKPIVELLYSKAPYATSLAKHFFLQTSALVAFWTERRQDACLYTQLLDAFWTRFLLLVTVEIKVDDHVVIDVRFFEQIIELVQSLQLANPSLEEHRVKFATTHSEEDNEKDEEEEEEEEEVEEDDAEEAKLNTEQGNDAAASSFTRHLNNGEKTPPKSASVALIHNELKKLTVQLVRLALAKKSEKYIRHVRRLMHMFKGDTDFYLNLTDERSLHASMDLFAGIIDSLDKTPCANEADKDRLREAFEVVVDVIFEMLQELEKPERFAYIDNHLLKIPHGRIQFLILQRLLSYPFCIEQEVRTMLMQTDASAIILNIAREAVIVSNTACGISQNAKNNEKINLLHKCFFQTETGEILIAPATVDAILSILSEPLTAAELDEVVEGCGSFVAQIMPVVCSNDNASLSMRNDIFIKLFTFSMKHTSAHELYLSEDTLWEITTCWQDALSSEDIIMDDQLLGACAAVVEKYSLSENLTAEAIVVMAEVVARLITCSTENIKEDAKQLAAIDKAMSALFTSDVIQTPALQELSEFSAGLGTLKAAVSNGYELSASSMTTLDLQPIFQRTLLNCCTLTKLVCVTSNAQNEYQYGEDVADHFCDANENLLKNWSEDLLAEILKCIDIAAMGDDLLTSVPKLNNATEVFILGLSERVKAILRNSSGIVNTIKDRMLVQAAKELSVASCAALSYLVHCEQYAQFEDNAAILLAEDLSEYFVSRNALKAYVNSLQYLLPNLEQNSITMQSAIMRTDPSDMWVKAAVFRCLIDNNFEAEINDKSDKNIIILVLQFVTHVAEKQHNEKELLLYNVEIQKKNFSQVIDTVEYINLLVEVLNRFPHELTVKNWDVIRIGLSSWVLSISKSIESYRDPKVAIFIVSVFKLFAALSKFIISEKQKSSTELLKNVIDEWENLFAREVNLVLFKSFYNLCKYQEAASNNIECYVSILKEITPAVELIDYSVVYNFCKNSTKITLDNVCNFLLKNLSNGIHSVRTVCMHILRQLTPFFVAEDVEAFEKRSDTLEGQAGIAKWHYLNRFEDYINRYDSLITKYLEEFSFKLIEIRDLSDINRDEALSYLMLWDCIVYACANSPVPLRSVYTNWLHENKLETNLLHFLFRAMPVEILKNHDSKIMNGDIFKGLSWAQITDWDLSLEKYVCHMYAEVLRKLPAVVRRWWNTSLSRQKTFVDKLTSNYVSALICNEELKAIGNKKEKHENMQVTVHTSTREVLAVYSIDEARMELVITLAQNYPLGAVKVECGRQIGGRLSSRNVGMQLTIFLTHQNGTIFDGLTLWKNSLDKKFEGVEECYVCYTVIHHDTCQLPKLSCRTCKKKFHGPCLYKWFTTSSKSTCPICRNVF